jgi:hypothetical protein
MNRAFHPLRLRTAAAALLLAAGGCARSVPEPRPGFQAALDTNFQVSRGQTASIPGERLIVTFTRVVQDSRCPPGRQCVRAGEARAELELRLPRRAAERVVLSTAGTPAYASFGAYDLHLVALSPGRTPEGRRTRRYTATVRVHRR